MWLQKLVENESGFAIECWRLLSAEALKTHFDPAFELYHGIALVDTSRLLQPGETLVEVSNLSFTASAAAFLEEHPDFKLAAQNPTPQSRFTFQF